MSMSPEAIKARLDKPIGETVVSRLEVRVCRGCGFIITEMGMCTYGCNWDCESDRPPESVLVRVWERTDRLVEVRG